MNQASRRPLPATRLAVYAFLFAFCLIALMYEAYHALSCDSVLGTVRAVGKTTPQPGTRGPHQYALDYDYVDANGDRHAGQVFRDFFIPQPGTQVEVQYFRERPAHSRLASSPLWTLSIASIALLLAIAFAAEVVMRRRGSPRTRKGS